MRALLTGSTGFVGQNLQRYLRQQGWDIETIERQDSPSDMDSKMGQFKPDVVIHLATLFIAEHKPTDIGNLIQSNIKFGTEVVDAMIRNNIANLINTGTLWQYYEGDRLSPSSLYSATKSAFESILRFYVSANSLRVINLMLSDTYGPKDPRGKLLSKLISMAGTAESLQLSPGEQKIEWTYIDDIVAGFEVAAQRLIANKESQKFVHYTVTSGELVSLKDTVKICESVLGKKINVDFGAKPYRKREIMSPSKLDPVLPGWTAKVSLKQGIEVCSRD
jgi:nucleoside-diphosphate-sugar epimerase